MPKFVVTKEVPCTEFTEYLVEAENEDQAIALVEEDPGDESLEVHSQWLSDFEWEDELVVGADVLEDALAKPNLRVVE